MRDTRAKKQKGLVLSGPETVDDEDLQAKSKSSRERPALAHVALFPAVPSYPAPVAIPK